MPEPTAMEVTLDDAGPVLSARACAHCGAPVEAADRFCPACGGTQPVEAPSEPAGPARRFACKNCGAQVAVDPNQRSYTCAFCDSTYVVELPAEDASREPPEFVIGFGVTHEAAQEKFRRWIAENGWFRPGDLKSARIEEKLKGVYLPFWSFSMLAESDWSADVGEYWYRTETYTTIQNGKTVTRTRRVRETEWWGLSGRHHRYYSGYLVSGSRGLPQRDADRLNPFHLAALRRYAPYYLAGWLSEEYSVQRADALATCQQEFHRREQSNVAAHLPGDTSRDVNVRTVFSQINSDLILLPVYLLSYRYRNKLYRFLVNGQTGKTVGDKPVSWRRIGLAVAAAALAVVAVAIAVAAMQ
ncbi:MAG: zinc ribbon domain-containing protein [Pirellulales bacterium]|nr:zinc ribbon domain-containing protein [Pirellulales bacterium]